MLGNHPSLSKNQRGFNLVEMMLVIAIVAIMSAIAIPQIGQFLVNRDLKTAAEDIVGDIFELKHKALSENTMYRIYFDSDSNYYEILQCGNSGSPCQDYRNKLASKSPAAFRDGIIIEEVRFGGGTGSSVTFQTRGTATPGHIILRNRVGSKAIIKVNITGRTYLTWDIR